MQKSLTIRYLASIFLGVFWCLMPPVAAQPYLEYYNPETGFTPAQPNLTKVFLKLAASLEHHGSPEPYIRYVLAEHKRIDAKDLKATGKTGTARPAYFTDEYCDNLLNNWKRLEKPLQLDQLCRESGRYMRYAILGSWHKSPDELVAEEGKLNAAEKKAYGALVAKQFFKKSDFAALEAFYADGAGYDKLSQAGKGEMSQRISFGTMPPKQRQKYFDDQKGGTSIVKIFNEYQRLLIADINADGERKVTSETLEKMLIERLALNGTPPEPSKLKWDEKDALNYSHLVKRLFELRFAAVEGKVDERAAKLMRQHQISMVVDLMVIANSELLAAINEKSLKP
jgi:hypothetical protein